MRTAKLIVAGILLAMSITVPTVQAIKYYYVYHHVLDEYEMYVFSMNADNYMQEISPMNIDE